MTIRVEYVDYGVCGEYGFFGKVVAKSITAGMTEDEIKAEIKDMIRKLGGHVNPVRVEVV